MASGEASGKPWMPRLSPEDRERFAEKTRDLDMKFLNRDGESMSSDEWIEARADPDYVLVALDRIENLEVATTWIGVHVDSDPNWDHVIFGTHTVYLHPEDIARLEGPPPDPAEFLPSDPEESFNLLSLVEPVFGELIGRFGWRELATAEAGHRFIVDDFTQRFRADRSNT